MPLFCTHTRICNGILQKEGVDGIRKSLAILGTVFPEISGTGLLTDYETHDVVFDYFKKFRKIKSLASFGAGLVLHVKLDDYMHKNFINKKISYAKKLIQKYDPYKKVDPDLRAHALVELILDWRMLDSTTLAALKSTQRLNTNILKKAILSYLKFIGKERVFKKIYGIFLMLRRFKSFHMFMTLKNLQKIWQMYTFYLMNKNKFSLSNIMNVQNAISYFGYRFRNLIKRQKIKKLFLKANNIISGYERHIKIALSKIRKDVNDEQLFS